MPNEGEVYLVGNPPFLGSSNQEPSQKEDMKSIFSATFKNFKKLDYVSCWFKKGADYIRGNNAELALIATNSICQGDQVSLLWEKILDDKIEIGFSHSSFVWKNNAKGKAAVICVIVSLRNKSKAPKYLFNEEIKTKCANINAYLADGLNVFVGKENKPLSNLPVIDYGSKATDGGHLILSTEEKNELITDYPEAKKFVKKYLGSEELINGKVRWCLWIGENAIEEANQIPPIANRLKQVEAMRLASSKEQTRKFAKTPHRFAETRYQEKSALFIPSVSSENRRYIPMEYQDSNTVASNANFAAYELPKHLFSILTSYMHTLWVGTVGGRLKTDYRYSNTLCYNTFPIPNLTDEHISKLNEFANSIIRERVMLGGTLADLYDVKRMPESLKTIHDKLDKFVDSLYQHAAKHTKTIETDIDRLAVLFKLYKQSKEAA